MGSSVLDAPTRSRAFVARVLAVTALVAPGVACGGGESGPTDSGATSDAVVTMDAKAGDAKAGDAKGADTSTRADAGAPDGGSATDAGTDARAHADAAKDAEGGSIVEASTADAPSDAPWDAPPLSSILTVSVGQYFACATTLVGGVECWGYGRFGQLGNDSYSSSSSPSPVVGLSSGVTSLSAGNHGACAVTAEGQVVCWGDNTSAGDGDEFAGSIDVPAPVAGITSPAIAVAAGGSTFACALLASGGVQCWGNNANGQLGNGSMSTGFAAVNVTGLSSGVTAITAGGNFACALVTSGKVMCWGGNSSGQLGNGTMMASPTPVAVVNLAAPATAISAGDASACALEENGTIECWGDNANGQLGNGGTTTSSLPVPVTAIGDVTQISVGTQFACAVAEGTTRCWGADADNQLGDGKTASSSTPVPVLGLRRASALVSAGNSEACAVTTHNEIECWGDNGLGGLGSGTFNASSAPVEVIGFDGGARVPFVPADGGRPPGVTVAVGADFACGINVSGGAYCWGIDTAGELGDNAVVNYSSSPVGVVGLSAGVQAIATGNDLACAINSVGGIVCWGSDTSAALGDTVAPDGGSNLPVPLPVAGLTEGALGVAVGTQFACGITAAGGVDCWGLGTSGQLGNGATSSSSVPVSVGGLPAAPVTAVTAGAAYACALAGGGVYCWGLGTSGQLGTGMTASSDTAGVVSGLSSGVLSIAAGDTFACAVTSAGSVVCWGTAAAGLGNGTTMSTTPVPVIPPGSAGGAATDVCAGSGFACAVQGGGAVCWGANTKGQLGIGSTMAAPMPTAALLPSTPTTTVGVACGKEDTCFVTTTGAASQVYCVGASGSGQLGNGTLGTAGVLNAPGTAVVGFP